MSGSLNKLPTESTAPKRSVGRLIFRIVRWVTYAAAIITLFMVFHVAQPPIIATSPRAATRAEEKMQEVEQSVASGQSATLRLDQTELNSYLASHLDISPNATAAKASDAPTSSSNAPSADEIAQVRSTVRDVKVELIGDRVHAYVVFDFHGKDMTLQLEGKLSASNGYLRFEPISGQIGSLSIPQSALESALQKMMDSPENREKFKLPKEISDLRIENGEVVATYR
jgi:hypothetical protein